MNIVAKSEAGLFPYTKSTTDNLSVNQTSVMTDGRTAGAPTKSPLKWAGGKGRLISDLARLIPREFEFYFEPFFGGGALFFSGVAHQKNAVLSDANGKLIHTLLTVRDDVDGVIAVLRTLQYNREDYNEIRARNFSVGSPVQRASEFIYVNRSCFNGLYRENKKGQFNVPFGKYKKPTICDEPTLRAAARRLKGATLLTQDFGGVLEQASVGDVVYFDPPYAPVSETASFANYLAAGFSLADHHRLRDVAVALKERGVYVLLSHSSAPEIRELYAKGFQIHEIGVRRSINSNGSRRGEVTELLIV